MLQTSTGPPPDNERTTDSLDDLDRLLSNSDNFTDFVAGPVDASVHTPGQRAPIPRQHSHSPEELQQNTGDVSQQSRKQRALDKSREAQKRFRQRQRVCLPAFNAFWCCRQAGALADRRNLERALCVALAGSIGSYTDSAG